MDAASQVGRIVRNAGGRSGEKTLLRDVGYGGIKSRNVFKLRGAFGCRLAESRVGYP